MKEEFELTNTQTSFVLMAFTLAYGLFEIPTGSWGDRPEEFPGLTHGVMGRGRFATMPGGLECRAAAGILRS